MSLSGPSPLRRSTRPFFRLLGVGGLLLIGALAYLPSVVALHRLWTDVDARTYVHGYLLAAVSGALILRSKDELLRVPLRPAPWALAALLVLSLAWLFAWRACLQDVHLILWPALLLCATLAAFGGPTARLLLFPLGFLYFAFPWWGQLNALLQSLTIHAVNLLVWLTGLPAYVQGNLVHVPSGTLEIAAGCSGMHYLIVGLAVAALDGELRRDALPLRIWLLMLVGGLAVLGNWLRVFTIVVVGYATEMRGYLVAVDHYWFGWMVFAALIALFFWLTDRISAAGRPPTIDPPTLASPVPNALPGPMWMAATACMVLIPAVAYAIDLRSDRHGTGLRIEWPAAPRSWSGPDEADETSWLPSFPNPSASGLRNYRAPDGGTVELYCVGYLVQRQSGKLVGYYSSVAGSDPSLRVVAEHVARTAAGSWRELDVVSAGGAQSVVWSRYQIGEQLFVSPWRSQVAYGLAALATPPVSSLIALRAECTTDCEVARTRLETFASLTKLGKLVTREPRPGSQL